MFTGSADFYWFTGAASIKLANPARWLDRIIPKEGLNLGPTGRSLNIPDLRQPAVLPVRSANWESVARGTSITCWVSGDATGVVCQGRPAHRVALRRALLADLPPQLMSAPPGVMQLGPTGQIASYRTEVRIVFEPFNAPNADGGPVVIPSLRGQPCVIVTAG